MNQQDIRESQCDFIVQPRRRDSVEYSKRWIILANLSHADTNKPELMRARYLEKYYFIMERGYSLQQRLPFVFRIPEPQEQQRVEVQSEEEDEPILDVDEGPIILNEIKTLQESQLYKNRLASNVAQPKRTLLHLI